MKKSIRKLPALPVLLVLLLPVVGVVQAQDYSYTINGDGANTVTITSYIGSGGDVTIPDTIDGTNTVTRIADRVTWDGIHIGAFLGSMSLTNVTIPNTVTYIGYEAFAACTNLRSVTIPNSVTNIGAYAFGSCISLASVLLPDSVTSIEEWAFSHCSSLTSVTIPNGVTSIPAYALEYCASLTNVTLPSSLTRINQQAFRDCPGLSRIRIPNSVTNIEGWAFLHCTNLSGVYFEGNAPTLDAAFYESDKAILYYLSGTTGWDQWVGPPPAVPWKPELLSSDASFGVRANQYGFNISWARGTVVVVEACTNLTHPVWFALQTNTLADGSAYFSDSQWTNYPGRFYRLRSP